LLTWTCTRPTNSSVHSMHVCLLRCVSTIEWPTDRGLSSLVSARTMTLCSFRLSTLKSSHEHHSVLHCRKQYSKARFRCAYAFCGTTLATRPTSDLSFTESHHSSTHLTVLHSSLLRSPPVSHHNKTRAFESTQTPIVHLLTRQAPNVQ
jgi:hypothetical protein